MKMEFMEGKKSLHVHSCLLWERGQKQETDPGAFLALRLQAGLS